MLMETPQTRVELTEHLPEYSSGYVQKIVSNMTVEGILRKAYTKNGIPVYAPNTPQVEGDLEIWAPELTNHVKWPNNSEMRELESYSAQYKVRGKSCPTCGKAHRDNDSVGTFKNKGVEYICPDDDYGHMRLRLAYRYWLAGIPLEYQSLDWSDYPYPNVKEEIDKYCENHHTMFCHGLGWLISGKSLGSGKSWTATHVLKQMVKVGYSGWWMSFTDIVSLYNEPDSGKKAFVINKIRESSFLVIDDVLRPVSDAQRGLYEDRWEEVLRYRTNMGFPTIVSTNLDEDEISELYPRIYSLLSAKQYTTTIEAPDARLHEVRDRNIEMAENGEVRPIT